MLIELLVAIVIVALIAAAASMAIFQTINVTKRNNNHVTVIQQVQNAGYWISRDALMAETVADNLTLPYFLILNWTEWDYVGDDSVYHSVTYFFEDLSGGIGKLKRTHSSGGTDEETLVAEHILYDPGDSDNTTSADYTNSVLTIQIAASFGEAKETKEYRVWHRPNF